MSTLIKWRQWVMLCTCTVSAVGRTGDFPAFPHNDHRVLWYTTTYPALAGAQQRGLFAHIDSENFGSICSFDFEGCSWITGFPESSVGKESACNAGDPSLIPESGRSPGEGIGYPVFLGFPCGSAGKESACNAGDLGSILELGRFSGEGNAYPLEL